MVVMGDKKGIIAFGKEKKKRSKTMSGYPRLWCFSETAGERIPGRLPETTQKQRARGAKSRSEKQTSVIFRLLRHCAKKNKTKKDDFAKLQT